MERIKWINNLKGFLMICVVAGHAITGSARQMSTVLGSIYDYIYLFHMPLFFLLAGYLFECNREKYKWQGNSVFIKNKCLALIVPYFSYSLLTYAGLWVIGCIPQLGAVLGDSYKVGTIRECIVQILFWQNSLDQHLWFIYALFFIFVINIFEVCSFNSKNKGCLILLLVAVIGHCITLKCPMHLIQRVLNYLVYFVIGRIVIRNSILEKLSPKISTVCSVALSMSIVKLLILNVIFNNYFLTVLKALFSICVSVSMGLALCLVFRKFENANVNILFTKIYKYNFEIYLLHQPFIVSGITLVLLHFTSINPVVIVFVSTTIGLLLSIVFARVLGANKVIRKVLFGRGR